MGRDSKERLKEQLEKKIMTAGMFTLSQFEIAFGDIWGHGLSKNELDVDQKVARKQWDMLRNSVLDEVNRQVRNMKSEIDRHQVQFEGYKYQGVRTRG